MVEPQWRHLFVCVFIVLVWLWFGGCLTNEVHHGMSKPFGMGAGKTADRNGISSGADADGAVTVTFLRVVFAVWE